MPLFRERRTVIALSLVSAIAAAVLIFVATNASTAQAPPDVVSTEDYRALFAVRYPVARAAALADPRVQEVMSTAVLNQTEVELRDSQDVTIIKTWGKWDTTGSWQDGYVLTFSEGKVVEVLVDRNSNAVVSVNVTPREDEVSNWRFSDNQKRLISLLVSDPRFQNEFAGKSDAVDYFFSTVRNVASDDPTSTAFIVIIAPSDKRVLYFATIDPVTNEVLSVKDWT